MVSLGLVTHDHLEGKFYLQMDLKKKKKRFYFCSPLCAVIVPPFTGVIPGDIVRRFLFFLLSWENFQVK